VIPAASATQLKGGRRDRDEGVLDDIAEDRETHEKYHGFGRGHAPPDGEDDRGRDDQNVGDDDQISVTVLTESAAGASMARRHTRS
jgi:hypothetical protein